MTASHYTATVEVTLTTRTAPTTSGRGYSEAAQPATRDVVDVARLVIRAATLPELVDKITAHAALLGPKGTA